MGAHVSKLCPTEVGDRRAVGAQRDLPVARGDVVMSLGRRMSSVSRPNVRRPCDHDQETFRLELHRDALGASDVFFRPDDAERALQEKLRVLAGDFWLLVAVIVVFSPLTAPCRLDRRLSLTSRAA